MNLLIGLKDDNWPPTYSSLNWYIDSKTMKTTIGDNSLQKKNWEHLEESQKNTKTKIASFPQVYLEKNDGERRDSSHK